MPIHPSSDDQPLNMEGLPLSFSLPRPTPTLDWARFKTRRLCYGVRTERTRKRQKTCVEKPGEQNNKKNERRKPLSMAGWPVVIIFSLAMPSEYVQGIPESGAGFWDL